MPQIIAAALLATIPELGTIAFGTTTFATIAAYGITAAATIGLEYAVQALQDKQAPAQLLTRQAIPPRTGAFGRCKLGGPLVADGTFDGTLIRAVAHCQGPIDAVEEWWLDDRLTTIPSGSLGGIAGVSPWGSSVTLESHLGDLDQAASALLLGAFPGLWTSSHKLNGIFYSVVQYAGTAQSDFPKVYPSGPPGPRVLARTAKVFDPRDNTQSFATPATWKWSRNAGLCIMKYLTDPEKDGFAIPIASINLASFSAFATLCDQSVTKAFGGTIPRYTCDGTFSYSQQKFATLRQLLKTCDGELFTFGDGTIGIRGGQWDPPAFTIDATMIKAYDYEQGNGKLSAFNRFNLTYIDPSSDYQPQTGAAWDDSANQALRGEVLTSDFRLDFINEFATARRLAKIAMIKGNPQHRFTSMTCTFAALRLWSGQSTIQIVLPELGINTSFLIERLDIQPVSMTCVLQLSSLDATAYAWTPATEEGSQPAAPQNLQTNTTTPNPANIQASVIYTNVNGGMTLASIKVTANQVSGRYVLIGRIRIQGQDDNSWVAIHPSSLNQFTVMSDTVSDGVTYEIEVAYQTTYGTYPSPWSSIVTVGPIHGQAFSLDFSRKANSMYLDLV